jgi:hypothetical protein
MQLQAHAQMEYNLTFYVHWNQVLSAQITSAAQIPSDRHSMGLEMHQTEKPAASSCSMQIVWPFTDMSMFVLIFSQAMEKTTTGAILQIKKNRQCRQHRGGAIGVRTYLNTVLNVDKLEKKGSFFVS